MSQLLKEAESIPHTKHWGWYVESVGGLLSPTARDLLERYSGVAPKDVREHVEKVVSCPPVLEKTYDRAIMSASFDPNPHCVITSRLSKTDIRYVSYSAIWHGRFSHILASAASGSSASASQRILITRPSSLSYRATHPSVS